ncbi:hypothetical protein HZY97_15805 [Sphingomonas sp. R-74633]|uniref:hypothetical protein n=1 Tax=Sphingomonas sp. R-74633 TaxID=2751188 RepID=UPI0015D31AD9|nr:hypothetical protein [Sphingomonas sp. R-74633]NYT42237.1 hypothetical protein [Sphingomonas sp. R-74633]
MENAKQLVGLLVQASMFLLIMAVAMQCAWRDVVEQVRHPRFLLRALIAVNVVVPVVAVLLTLALDLPRPIAAGLILMAVSPLAPLVPGKATKTGADRANVVATYLLLITLAIPIVPLSMAVVDRIFGVEAIAPAAVIAKVAFISGLLPIILGLAFAGLAPSLAARAAPVMTLIAVVVLGLFVLLVLWMQGRIYLGMIGGGTIFAFALTSAAAVIGGHFLATDPENRGALAVAAATRHPGMAFAIAHASGAEPAALAAILLFLIVSVIVVAIYLAWLKKQAPAEAPQ